MDLNLTHIVANIPDDSISKPVRSALAFEKAAQEHLDKIVNAEPVDLASAITPADIATVHAKALDQDRNRDKAIELAQQLTAIATERLTAAWMQEAMNQFAAFGTRFDAAAAELYKELEKFPHQDPNTLIPQHWNTEGDKLRELVNTLETLARVRDAYHHMASTQTAIFSTEYDKSSRTAIFDDNNIEQRFRYFVSAHPERNYWLILANTEGARIAWQTRAQQQQQPIPAAVIRSQTAMAAQTARAYKKVTDEVGEVIAYETV